MVMPPVSNVMGVYPVNVAKIVWSGVFTQKDTLRAFEYAHVLKYVIRKYVQSEDFNKCLSAAIELDSIAREIMNSLEAAGIMQTVISKDALFDNLSFLYKLREKRSADYIMSSDWSLLNLAIYNIFRAFRDLTIDIREYGGLRGDQRASGNVLQNKVTWHYVLVVTDNGELHVLDRDFQYIRKFELGSCYSIPTSDSEGNLVLVRGNKVVKMTPEGETIWEHELSFTPKRLVSPAITSDDFVYVSSEVGKLAKLDYNGRLVWEFEDIFTSELMSYHAPVIGEDGAVYDFLQGSPVGRLYAILPDGSLYWYLDIGSEPYGLVSYTTSGIIGVSSFGDTAVYMVDKEANRRWVVRNSNNPMTVTSRRDGTIFVPAYRNFLYGFDPSGLPTIMIFDQVPIYTPAIISPEGWFVYESAGYDLLGNYRVVFSSVARDGSRYLARIELPAVTTYPVISWDGMVIYSYKPTFSGGYIYVEARDSELNIVGSRIIKSEGNPIFTNVLV